MLEKIQKLDNSALALISHIHTAKMNRVMVIITNLGTNSTIWACFALSFLFIKEKRIIGYKIAVALILAAFSGEGVIKPLVKRLRPCEFVPQVELLVRKPSTYSFPSGHTTSSFSAAYILAKNFPNISILIFLIAALIAFSRLYLRVHYPTDVLAGMVLGILCALTVLHVL
ncbi:MAG: phosphatase PAP2 family protein [Oscillospiraceae bacterium]|jgi:undecaprenyl-diphosphatase|nr:phosphatase PAP2 family protein [Oscillospiraceae bacterium]